MSSFDQFEDAPPSKESIRKGRNKLLALSFTVLWISLFIILEYNFRIGTVRLPAQIIRFCLTILLLAAVYKGSMIAKWIAVVLLSLASVGYIVLAIAIPNLDWLRCLAFLMNCITYAYYVLVLLFSDDVAAHMTSMRERKRLR